MPIYESVADLIGSTPLLALNRYAEGKNLAARLLAKLEGLNPAGSAKDRVALMMITAAEESGELQPGAAIIEPTSGNTGIGLAALAAARGYKLCLTMPETMSIERRLLLAAYGAKIVLTDGALGMQGAIDKAKELHAVTPGSYLPRQFENPANPAAHYAGTGPEIWKDSGGSVDILVAGVGTGGTLSGAGKYLKEKNPALQVIAVEPADSPVLSGGAAGPHAIQGIGAGFIPEIFDAGLCDEIITVKADDAYAAGRELALTQGVLVGISSGAALWAAAAVAARPENTGKTVVVILPDTGERYLSTPLFAPPEACKD